MGLMLTPCGKIPIAVGVMGTAQGVMESPVNPNWMAAIDSYRVKSAALLKYSSAVHMASSGPPVLFARRHLIIIMVLND